MLAAEGLICEAFMQMSEPERRQYSIGWVSGASVADEFRAMYLLATKAPDDFVQRVEEMCAADAAAPASGIIRAALEAMASSGDYSLLEFGIVIAPSDRVAEVFSSSSPFGTVSPGFSIDDQRRRVYCSDARFPIQIHVPDEILLSVGDELRFKSLVASAYDSDGSFVPRMPLVLSEPDVRNTVLVRESGQEQWSYVATRPGSKKLQLRPHCEGQSEPVADLSIRVVE